MHKLEKYVGRIVRLNQQAFQRIIGKRKNMGTHLDNCFLVAAVNRKIGRLICYGANWRIVVCPAEIVLI